MKKTRAEKGITLVALIITIVVLLILAAVAINSITNDGIIGKAESAKEKYELEKEKEKDMLGLYEQFLSGNLITVKQAQSKGEPLSTAENKTVYDELGNKIVVPAGFKITTDADTVPEGIVIEDVTYTDTMGSQFVWIPVGDVKSNSGTKTITLGRYVFANGSTDYDKDGTKETAGEIVKSLSVTNPKDQLLLSPGTPGKYGAYYIESLDDTIMEAFIKSANTNGGYYIGRYEARTNNTTGREAKTDELTPVTTVKTNAVYNYVTKAQALNLSKEMYQDGYKADGTGTFSSVLLNSFAWDTAIVFIQTFEDNDYSMKRSVNGSLEKTGTTTDVVCNIYDMASNCAEVSTEIYISEGYGRGTIARGGWHVGDLKVHSRTSPTATQVTVDYRYCFRPVIYLGI